MARSANVTWQDSNLSRALRWRALGARGATVWLTGVDQVYEPPVRPEVTVGPVTDVASAVDAVLGFLDGAVTAARPPRGGRRFSWGREWGRSHQRNGVK